MGTGKRATVGAYWPSVMTWMLGVMMGVVWASMHCYTAPPTAQPATGSTSIARHLDDEEIPSGLVKKSTCTGKGCGAMHWPQNEMPSYAALHAHQFPEDCRYCI